MSAPTCGLNEYGVTLVKNGRRLSTAGASLERIEWGRVLDAPSKATIDLITAGEDCCGQLGAVDHWNTDLIISATNPDTLEDDVVWRGPVRKATFRKGSVTIEGVDNLGWLQVRGLFNDLDFDDVDVSEIFVGIWNDAVAAYDSPVHSLVVLPCGVVESRRIDGDDQRMGWNVVSEMLDAGLDVTTFGSQILVGIPTFTPIDLKDTDVIGQVEVVKDGEQFANRVLANASKDILGIWPEGPRTGSNGYPLVEAMVVDSQLEDVESATAAAKARHDYSANGVRRVQAPGGLELKPSANIDVKALLAGQLFNFAATETCYTAEETLRLANFNVTATKGEQKVTIDLQPTGSVQGGATLSGV